MLRRRWDEAGTSTLGFSQLEGPRALLGGKRKSAGVAAELWMWHLHLSHNLAKWVTLETEDQRTHNSPRRHTNAQLFFWHFWWMSCPSTSGLLHANVQPATWGHPRQWTWTKAHGSHSTDAPCPTILFIVQKEEPAMWYRIRAQIPKDLFLFSQKSF